jgi:hypothetical protein
MMIGSELDVLGAIHKLVKDVVHPWRRNFEKINYPLLISCLNSKQPLLDFKDFQGLKCLCYNGKEQCDNKNKLCVWTPKAFYNNQVVVLYCTKKLNECALNCIKKFKVCIYYINFSLSLKLSCFHP